MLLGSTFCRDIHLSRDKKQLSAVGDTIYEENIIIVYIVVSL